MKISVIGSGYVGLVAGICFSDFGNEVTCVDLDKKKIKDLTEGKLPIYEPGLDLYLQKNIKEERLFFTTDIATSIKNTDVIFIAVGTPMDEDGSADLSYVLKVAEQIAVNTNSYKVIILKSTVPVGTAEKVENLIKSKTSLPFDVISNPEFLKEGAALNDFLKPDRVVIGYKSEKARKIMEQLYAPLVMQGNPIIFMDNKSAELTKYASNSFLATKVSFINDIALLAEKVGADINSVRRGMTTDSRIGNKFLYPGCGYGGSCFPKDVQALIRIGKDYDHKLRICESVEDVNNNQKKVLFHKIKDYFNGKLKDKKIAVWGLAFKPETDDMREAPSIAVITELINAGAIVRAYDPAAKETARLALSSIKNNLYIMDKAFDVLEDADALVLITEWNEFRNVDFSAAKKVMKTPILFDGRNIYAAKNIKDLGFTYFGIGTKG